MSLHPYTRQAGLSLVEVMVGMVLGLIVVSGAVAIYLASSRSYSESEQVGQLSENSRFVEQILTDGLRHAGFMGEANALSIEDPTLLGAIVDTCADTERRADPYTLGVPIFAVVATATASNPDIGCIAGDPDNNALVDTEILIIKSAVPLPISDGPRGIYTGPTQSEHTNNLLDYPDDLMAGKLYLLTNSVKGLLFDSDGAQPSIMDGGDVPGGTAWEYRYELYFIRDVSNADGKLMPRLSRMVLAESSPGGAMALVQEDLVPDVEDMRMRFGLDTIGEDGEVDIYRTVAQINADDNWDAVVSIEIALLVSSAEADPNYSDANTYTLAGRPVTPHETRLQHRRQVVRANVSLRNVKFVIRG